jgi:hypothetical protein
LLNRRFSENDSLLFVCYQFLLDRIKAEDMNGTLAHTIFELLIMTTSMTEAKLEKTYLGKVLDRYLKTGHAKSKFYAKKILDATAAASKTVSVKKEPEAAAGVKRSSSVAGNATNAAAPKKTTTTNGTAATSTKPAAVVKKPVSGSEALKKTTSAATVSTGKKVVAKPSGFFSLQSASKKPGTSNAEKTAVKSTDKKPVLNSSGKPAFNLAETLANLSKPKEEPKKAETKPDTSRDLESAEVRAKRTKRLARGAVGVRFKDDANLVEVRLFAHDPEEEIDHDASQMRDVKDVGGEGRMLKQHMSKMGIDDEDDSGSDDDKNKLVPFKVPSDIDFSVVDAEERDRLYARYGGGKLQPDSPENAVRQQYEANNLIVVYNDSREVPANPREPADPYNGEQGGALTQFGAPPDKYALRAREKQQQRAAQAFKQIPAQMPNFSLANLAAFSQSAQPAQPTPPVVPHDLSALLAQLQANGIQVPNPAPQMQNPAYGVFPTPPPFNFAPPPQPPAIQATGEPDISAILAALHQTSGAAAPAPPMNGFQGYPNMMAYTPQPTPAAPANDNPWYKTKVCKYWKDGKCTKGAGCSYLHE